MVERIGNEVSIDFGVQAGSEPTLVAQANPTPAAAPAANGQTAAPAAETRIVVELENGNVLRLPANASVDQPHENGTDLEFVQPDGTVIVVPDGAIQGLAIFIGDVEIPPITVAALFEANGIETAAGPAGAGARSSGGNFEVPVGGIGDAFDIGDLLPPTELLFGTNLDQPLYEGLVPTNAPVIGGDTTGAVVEAGNADDGTDRAGTTSTDPGAATAGTPTITGTLTATDPDGGDTATWSGNATGTYGSFDIDPTSGVWTYTLLNGDTDTDALAEGETRTETFTVTVDDGKGGTATQTVTITITGANDSPVIGFTTGNDAGSVTEDTAPSATGQLTSTDVDVTGKTATWSVSPNSPTTTSPYGTFTVDDTGKWTYTLGNNATVQALAAGQTVTETYTVRVTDDKGAWDDQEVTITITGTNDTPTGGGSVSLTVSEAALDTAKTGLDLAGGSSTGTNPSSPAETQQTSSGITFSAIGEAITVGFAAPGGSTWVPPTVNGLAAGYTISWALSGSELVGTLMNGLVSQGEAIRLALSGQTSASAGGTATPTVTATLTGPLEHAGGNGDITIGGIQVVAIDSSGDTVSANVSLKVLDDAPLAIAPEHGVLENTDGNSGSFELDTDLLLGNNYGADGGAVRFSQSLNGADSGLTSNGNPITYNLSNNGLTLTATANNSTVFTVTLDPASATYTVQMNGVVDSYTEVDFNSSGYDFVGGNNAWAGFVPTGDSLSNPNNGNNSADLLLTAIGGSVNTSAISGGVGNGASIGNGETFRIDFVQDLRNGGGQGYLFDHHYTTNGAAATFTATAGSKIRFTAFDDLDTNFNLVGETTAADRTKDTITQVIIRYGGASQVITASGTYTIGGQAYTVTFANGSVDIDGIKGTSGANATGTEVSVLTANGYNSLEYAFVSGQDFKIGEFGSSVPTKSPNSFNLPVEVIDGDGDVASANIGITLTPTGQAIGDYSASATLVSKTATTAELHLIGSDFNDTLTGNDNANALQGGAGDDTLVGGKGNDTLVGGLGNDILTGGDGDDILIGGLGNDTLTGNAGSDTFVFSETGTANLDTIADYTVGNDTIDLGALLDAALIDASNVGNYVRVQDTGPDALLQVDLDGAANGANWADVGTLTGHGTVGTDIDIKIDTEEFTIKII